MIDKESCFIGCDWGTTSLRMAVIEKKFGKVLAQTQNSRLGIKKTFEEWQQLGTKDSESRVSNFLTKLFHPLSELSQALGESLEGLSLLISGMASSSIGMIELPYAKLPFSLGGTTLMYKELGPSDEFPHPLILLSGVEKPGDVMRGEETQLLGLHSLVEDVDYLAILPGTHSKHIEVKKGNMVNFSTYMTGEVFDLLGKRSILSNSIQKNSTQDLPGKAFEEGVVDGAKENILGQLFAIRAGDLQGRRSPEEGYAYLSGLLMGSELGSLPKADERPIYLIGNAFLVSRYQFALNTLGMGERLKGIPKGETPLSFLGQLRVLIQV